MTDGSDDPNAPPEENPFEQFVQRSVAPHPAPAAPQGPAPVAPPAATSAASDNPFDQFVQNSLSGKPQPVTSAFGTVARAAAQSVAPAAAGWVGAGAGAEAGGIAGAAVGGPVGGAIGAVAGAIGGGLLASETASHFQQWAISKLPDAVQNVIGTPDQMAADMKEYPTLSFLTGTGVFLIGSKMGPFNAALDKALPASAAWWQKAAANPVTSHVASGVVMGGLEVGQEWLSGREINPQYVGIATAAGFFFNQPNRLGERLLGTGSGLIRRPAAATGAAVAREGAVEPAEAPKVAEPPKPPAPHATVADPVAPTVQEAASAKVFGGGVNEDVFHRVEPMEPNALLGSMIARENEREMLYGPPRPDTATLARESAPEVFSEHDRLMEHRDLLLGEIRQNDQPWLRERLDFVEGELERSGRAVGDTYQRAAESLGEAPPEPRAPRLDDEAWAARKGLVAADIERQLLGLGHAPDYAEASGALVGEYYGRRAGQLSLDDPFALYTREGPRISAIEEKPASPTEVTAKKEATIEVPKAETPRDPQQVWSELQANRQARYSREFINLISTRRNETTTNIGTPLHKARSQVWDVGNTVDSGFLKDLLIVSRDDAGYYQLVTRPNENGVSKSYYAKPHEGLAKGEEVNFLDAVKGLRNDVLEQRGAADELLGQFIPSKDGQSRIRLAAKADASSFFHEFGHQGLYDLLRDSARPEAPELMRADAEAVRQWLKMKPDAQPSRAQHERFARAYEQFLLTGGAPSTALQRVFAQIKEWMSKVYDTLAKRKTLGAEISPRVREAMANLTRDERATSIVPSRERAPSIADLHESDAQSARPGEEPVAAENIRRERERHVEEAPPGAVAAIEAVRAQRSAARGETPGGERPPGDVPAGAPVAGARPEVGGVAGGGEPQRASGAGAAPEGERAAGAPAGDVEKAGNLRKDTRPGLDEEIWTALVNTASERNGFLDARRGKVSILAQIEGAKRRLVEPDLRAQLDRRISEWKPGDAFSAEEILATEYLMREAAADSIAVARAGVGVGTPEAVLATTQAVERLVQFQMVRSGVTAEAGRALGAHRKVANAQVTRDMLRQSIAEMEAMGAAETSPEIYNQMRRLQETLSKIEDPNGVNTVIDRLATRRGAGYMVLETWINGLISGIQTHVSYAHGNALLQALYAGPDRFVAALISHARGRANNEMVRFGEAYAMYSGMAKGVVPAATAFVDAAAAGPRVLMPGEQQWAARKGVDQNSTYGMRAEMPPMRLEASARDLGASVMGVMNGLRDGVMAAGQLLHGGLPNTPLVAFVEKAGGVIPDIHIRGINALPVGSVIRSPGRMISAIHSYFLTTGVMMERHAGAWRMAATEFPSDPARFKARYENLVKNPTEQMMAVERETALQNTLMGGGGEFTKAVSKLVNSDILGFPYVKFLTPFVHIGSNIIEQSILRRTPVGLLSPEIRADLSGHGTAYREAARQFPGDKGRFEARLNELIATATPEAQAADKVAADIAAGRMLAGSMLAMLFGTLAAQGLLTGSGPIDKVDAANERAIKPEHSLLIGDMWYEVKRLGPIGLLAGISADAYETMHMLPKDDAADLAMHVVHAFAQNILDESFFTGLHSWLQAVTEPDRHGAQWAKNFISTFMPFSVGLSYTAKATDPIVRRTEGVIEAYRAKIPGYSQDLEPKIGRWGEPVTRQNFGTNYYSAISMKPLNQDPVDKALFDLHINVAPPKKTIRGVELEPKEYTEFAQLKGRLTKMQLDKLVAAPNFFEMPRVAQHDVISRVVKMNTRAAAETVMARHPRIALEAMQNQAARFDDDYWND